jgi:anti-sigma B factor antagonist
MLAMNVDADGRIVCAGRLYAGGVDEAAALLDALHGPVVLDCRALDYVSSAGLGLLLKTHERLSAAGGRLRLVGVNPHLRDVLAYSGLDRIIEVESAA